MKFVYRRRYAVDVLIAPRRPLTAEALNEVNTHLDGVLYGVGVDVLTTGVHCAVGGGHLLQTIEFAAARDDLTSGTVTAAVVEAFTEGPRRVPVVEVGGWRELFDGAPPVCDEVHLN